MTDIILNRPQISTASLEISKKPLYTISKRIIDIFLSLAILIISSPFMLIVAALIKVQSAGPIIYKSYRIGENKKVFACYKFRTMDLNASEKLNNLLKDKRLKKEWDKFHKIKEDPRIFTLGKVLRKYSLDELPQLFNVLKGEVSLVGPRPITVEEKSEVEEILKEKIPVFFSMKPGITGIWQTSGRCLISFEERLKMDLCYIEKRSLLADLKLLIRTVPIVLFSKGAY